ncbi:hhH-GPD superfamily base excision DNA repair protein domain-containing protein [Ditylenchus destructor]|uniref:N-glycosylase/DNA lyase n=1 Tax=Ditylenchus destructor TaxID=166010 RepID=A0AAD4N705_9BILA|nr:hhH-GPD superfamily base excision DNA repair protein domain-containing protein [Ditylenchus destructor]
MKHMIPCCSKQLNLDVVLLNGQSFRWNKVICPSDKTSVFVGVAKHRVWKLWRQNDNEIGFKVLNNFQQRSANIKGTENKVIQDLPTDVSEEQDRDTHVLKEYFQLDVDVSNLYREWCEKDDHFREQVSANSQLLEGIRILKQDPLETLLAFICSANNNIARISKMVQRLCELYGSKCEIVDEIGTSSVFYDFPTLAQLEAGLPDMEKALRDSGFGYRAGYIAGTVRKLCNELGREEWLHSLMVMKYVEAKEAVMQLPGVGPKVADCICLMALQKHEVVPVDTHVYQITAKFYITKYSANTKKKSATVSKAMHEEIGQFYVSRFGPYAGWAHSVLFSNRLKRFESDSVDDATTQKRKKF